ncbi:MAG: phage major capsid protein [Solirubrobacteraceae bacterium]|nr:phage major capsid protein [Patulibacter sp.]
MATSAIGRSDADALIPKPIAQDILRGVRQQSAALATFRSVEMSTKTYSMPALTALPMAYFVNGDTGIKQTSKAAWGSKTIVAEELACIVPVPEAVIDDAQYDIIAETKPLIVEAIGRAIDAAIFFGANAPASWTDANIVGKAVAAGNTVTRGTAAQNAGGLATDLGNVLASVEEDGYDPTAFIASRGERRYLRNARNTLGERYRDTVSLKEVHETPITYAMRGLWPTGSGAAEVIAVSGDSGIVGLRQDIRWKLLTEAVIQDPITGEIMYNLPQQDMVALRCTFRLGWVMAAPITPEGNLATGNTYPTAVLVAP